MHRNRASSCAEIENSFGSPSLNKQTFTSANRCEKPKPTSPHLSTKFANYFQHVQIMHQLRVHETQRGLCLMGEMETVTIIGTFLHTVNLMFMITSILQLQIDGKKSLRFPI